VFAGWAPALTARNGKNDQIEVNRCKVGGECFLGTADNNRSRFSRCLGSVLNAECYTASDVRPESWTELTP